MTWQEWIIVALLSGLTSVAGGEVIVSHITKVQRVQVAKSIASRNAGPAEQDWRICRWETRPPTAASSPGCALAP
jgi:hypothetical protein